MHTGGTSDSGAGGAAQGALPAPVSVRSPRFTSADRCAMCHAASGGDALRDAQGRDVSPFSLWRGSMMAFSARDPYHHAAVSHELVERPGAQAVIEATCIRCHAPEGVIELEGAGAHLGLDDLLAGTRVEDHLGREGVACTTCHQIDPKNLGDPSSFNGRFVIGSERRIYGPHQEPFPMPMQNHVGYTPTHGDHVRSSELCATCHTVVTRALDAQGKAVGPEVYEQAPFLEWQNSSFSSEPGAASCASCHMPVTDEEGNAITAKISNRPPWLDPRSPFGRHTLAGGNAYMLGLLANNTDWLNAGVPAEQIQKSADRGEAMLRAAAGLTVLSAVRQADTLVITVRVENKSGHKLPTGYPGRRAFLRLEARDAAAKLIFMSGRTDARGALVDGQGKRLDALGTIVPHRDEISSEGEVQVYESVLEDDKGKPTHVLFSAVGYAKDNRLLPAGYSSAHPNAAKTAPVGVEADANFGVSASDTVTYRIAGAPMGPVSVKVELVFQSIPPSAMDALEGVGTPSAQRFLSMAEARPPLPIALVSASAMIP